MPSPDVSVHVFFEGLVFPLWIEDTKSATIGLEFVDELLFGPELHIINKHNHMNSSFECLNEFIQSGISGR